MKYKKKNIDDVFRNKNWEGVKSFVDKFGMNLLILLDKIVKAKDWEKLKEQQERQTGGGGGVPPQFGDVVNQIKKFKLPGGPIVVLILLLLPRQAVLF